MEGIPAESGVALTLGGSDYAGADVGEGEGVVKVAVVEWGGAGGEGGDDFGTVAHSHPDVGNRLVHVVRHVVFVQDENTTRTL